jgi:hypothetical protein
LLQRDQVPGSVLSLFSLYFSGIGLERKPKPKGLSLHFRVSACHKVKKDRSQNSQWSVPVSA